MADQQDKPGMPVCLYTATDAKSKSNMALMVCLYNVSNCLETIEPV